MIPIQKLPPNTLSGASAVGAFSFALRISAVRKSQAAWFSSWSFSSLLKLKMKARLPFTPALKIGQASRLPYFAERGSVSRSRLSYKSRGCGSQTRAPKAEQILSALTGIWYNSRA